MQNDGRGASELLKKRQMGFPIQENREIRLSGDRENDLVLSTVARWYDFREPGGYLGNVGIDCSEFVYAINGGGSNAHATNHIYFNAIGRRSGRPDFRGRLITRFLDFPVSGSPFALIFSHSDAPRPSLCTRHRFPRPTPERVFVGDH